jgi:hypothetical protein
MGTYSIGKSVAAKNEAKLKKSDEERCERKTFRRCRGRSGERTQGFICGNEKLQ